MGIFRGLSPQFVKPAQGSDASITVDQDRALAVVEMLAPSPLRKPLRFLRSLLTAAHAGKTRSSATVGSRPHARRSNRIGPMWPPRKSRSRSNDPTVAGPLPQPAPSAAASTRYPQQPIQVALVTADKRSSFPFTSRYPKASNNLPKSAALSNVDCSATTPRACGTGRTSTCGLRDQNGNASASPRPLALQALRGNSS